MLVTPERLATFFTGIRTNFRRGYTVVKPQYERIAMTIPSNTERERYDWLGDMAEMREWLGDRVIHSLATHGFEIENRDWELTLGVDRNKLEDDTFGVYSMRAQKMGQSVALAPERLMFGLLNNGRAATSLGYDGVPFFSAAHPNDYVGTESNLHSDGAGPYWYLLQLDDILKPLIYQLRKAPELVSITALTAAEVFHKKRFLFGVDGRWNGGYGFWQMAFASNRTPNATNLEAAILAMSQRYNSEGTPMNFAPTHVVYPTSQKFIWEALIKQQMVNVGGVALPNIHWQRLELIESRFLSNT